MNTKEYQGKIIRLSYPSFLKVKTEEPHWSAFAPKGKASAMIQVDPIPSAAEAFARMVRNPDYTKIGGASIEREGDFLSSKGIKGYERIARLDETMAWLIVGEYQNKHPIIIQLSAIESEWQGGTIWHDLIESIEVI